MKKSLVHLIRGVQLGPMLRRERHVGEHIGLGLVEEAGQLRQLGTELIRNLAPLGSGCLGIVLGKGCGDEGGDDATAALAAWANALRMKWTRGPLKNQLEPNADTGCGSGAAARWR